MSNNNDDKYPDSVEADRDIKPLSGSSSKTPGYVFMVAAAVGLSLFAWSQLRPKKVEVVEKKVYQPQSKASIPVPEIQKPPPVKVVEPKKTVNIPKLNVVDPMEMERVRQKHALELERLRQAQKRLEEARKEAEKRRRSPILVKSDSADNVALSSVGTTLPPGFKPVGEMSFNEDGTIQENEVFNDRAERFLRDAGRAKVEQAVAVNLENQDSLITQGTFIAGVLETAINSDLPGMVRALVHTPVYSRTGKVKLIPRGSRLIGRYQSGMQEGQTRVFVAWTRLERPDGIVIDLGSPGADELGRSGMSGGYSSHFFRRFGSAALLSIIGSGVAIAGSPNSNAGGNFPTERDRAISDASKRVGDSFRQTSEQSLSKSMNIPPTVTIPQGAKINIFVARDLSFHNALNAE